MALYIKNGTSSLLAVSGSLAGAADCCCDPCTECLNVSPLADCECMSADETESTQGTLQVTVGGNITIPGTFLCSPVPSTQAVSTTFNLSCDAGLSGDTLWGGSWLRHWQYCTYLVTGTTYRTYTLTSTIVIDCAKTITAGTYNCNITSSAWLTVIQHTGSTPPTDSCVGSWNAVPASCGVTLLGSDSASPATRVAQATSVNGTYNRGRYSIGVECPESCQIFDPEPACAVSFGSFSNSQTESTANADTNSLTFSASIV